MKFHESVVILTVVAILTIMIVTIVTSAKTTNTTGEGYKSGYCYNAKSQSYESSANTTGASCSSKGCHMLEEAPTNDASQVSRIMKTRECCDIHGNRHTVDTNGMPCACAFPGQYTEIGPNAQCTARATNDKDFEVRNINYKNCSASQYAIWNKRVKVRDLLQSMLDQGKWHDAFATNLNLTGAERFAIQTIVKNVKNMLDMQERTINQDCPPRYCLYGEERGGSWGYENCQHQPPDWYDPKVYKFKQWGDPLRKRIFSAYVLPPYDTSFEP